EHTQCVADHVTVSIGVATVVAKPDVLSSELIRQADENLYKAKAAGKDRVVYTVFEPA
ncbi:MAG: GGDEF domain-containing protein, partial [Leptonema sp. (in: Bacteria)]|nr:GGDEF domain-containing protein [Leptonema sp. (in: bacteria)]